MQVHHVLMIHVGLSVTVSLSHWWAVQKQLKQSSCHLGSGLGWVQWTMYCMRSRCQHGKGQFWGGNRQTIVKYRDTPRSSVQTQLNQSSCCCGCGLAWAQGIMCYMESRSCHLKGQFWWIGSPIVNYRYFLPLAVQKRLNRSICHLGCGLKWAEGCTNSIVFASWRQCALTGGHIAVTCQITLNHLSMAVMRLMLNYFDHLLPLEMPT